MGNEFAPEPQFIRKLHHYLRVLSLPSAFSAISFSKHPLNFRGLHLTKNNPPSPNRAPFCHPKINICSTQTRILLKKSIIQDLLVAQMTHNYII
jgi:hypothetical protein